MEHGPSAISRRWSSTQSLSFVGFGIHAQNMHKNGLNQGLAYYKPPVTCLGHGDHNMKVFVTSFISLHE
jgi:hypothetical protein